MIECTGGAIEGSNLWIRSVSSASFCSDLDSSEPMKNTIGTIAATKAECGGKQPPALGQDAGKELVDRRDHGQPKIGRAPSEVWSERPRHTAGPPDR